jgi:hypothetical protein
MLNFLRTTKVGYDNYAWIWWIVSLSVIIGNSLFGLVGVSAIVFSFALFYILGILHKHVVSRAGTD